MMNGIRPEVMIFAGEMEQKLRKNDHKVHWSKCGLVYLINGLQGELDELKTAYSEKNDMAIVDEAVDVANFAMMVYDWCLTHQEECEE